MGETEGAGPALTPEVREALTDLQRYLSDYLAPLMVADSIGLLMSQPPELAAGEIESWTIGQLKGRGGEVPLADYLFHAMQKIHELGEYNLVQKEELARYLGDLAQILLAYCPEEDRPALQENLARLGQAQDSILAAPVEVLRRQGLGSEAAKQAAPLVQQVTDADTTRRMRRLSILMERLETGILAGAVGGAGGRGSGISVAGAPGGVTPGGEGAGAAVFAPAARGDPLIPQFVTTAVASARSEKELATTLQPLTRLGMSLQTTELLRILARALPAWTVPLPAPPGDATEGGASPRFGPGAAIRRIVTMPEDPAEVGRRFHAELQTAVESFNGGNLAQSVRLLEEAGRILAEKKVDGAAAEASRKRALDGLDPERLRSYAEETQNHPLLRAALSFFPALTPRRLLSELQVEEKRERRRLLLSLLEVHGATARTAALEGLQASLAAGSPSSEWHFKRNLLYLLRRIPRPPEQPEDAELEALGRLSDPDLPAPLVKEALAALGHARDDRAEAIVQGRVQDLVRRLQEKGSAPFDEAELQPLLDRALSVLARFGTSTARRVVIDHGLKKKGPAADPARLADLAGQDLSHDPELVGELLKALRAELPVKVLGVVVGKPKADRLVPLIEALSSTPLPQVRQALEEVVQRFPGQEFARTAEEALAALSAPPAGETPTVGLSGDLDVFQLPGLLQSLAGSEVTGALTLREPKGATVGVLTLEKGRIRSCQAGTLQGEDACYQLLERPVTGTFTFARLKELPPRREKEPPLPDEVVSLLMEGMRRYDELQRCMAIAPDDLVLRKTEVKPTPHPEEADPTVQQAIWVKASAGASPRLCEQTARVDAFRVRRLLAHWVEEGSLSIVRPGPASP